MMGDTSEWNKPPAGHDPRMMVLTGTGQQESHLPLAPCCHQLTALGKASGVCGASQVAQQ